MGRRGAKSFPPRRLAALSDAQLRWLRPLWFLALALALVADVAGTVFIWRDAYDRNPVFARFAISSQIEDDGSVTFGPLPGREGATPVVAGSRILAIDGTPLDPDARIWTIAERLAAVDRQAVTLTVVSPAGDRATHRIVPNDRFAREPVAVAIPRDQRMIIRLAISFMTCATLIVCSALLFLRRPRDPVAMLFAFAFMLFAGMIDPPLLMWMGLGLGTFFEAVTTIAWLCLVVGIAAFPDGRFNPRSVRWILVAAPALALALALPSLPETLGVVVTFVLPLLLVGCNVVKYRRLAPGIERQQVKWAAFGFASGLILLLAAFVLVAVVPETSPSFPLYSLGMLALFSFGFLLMALGLLVSLLRFRLWEADQVISRSAVSAAVTLGVGIIWTLSTDLVKSGVEMTLGQESLTVATVASAVLAAGIFAPTQALAQRWAKRKFDGDNERIRNLIARLAVWRTSETPEEIGMRSLSALAAAVHCKSAAIVLDTPHGRSLVASRDLDDTTRLAESGIDPSSDRQFVMQVPLEDEDGPIGQLLLGPRSDLNRYNSSQTAGIQEVAEPLAEAFRAAVRRAQHSDSVHRLFGAVEERLSRLEGGSGLSPA